MVQRRRRLTALGILNEAIGLGVPIVAVPFPNIALAQHPAFIESIGRLRSWAVDVLFDPGATPQPRPNLGSASRDLFPWGLLWEHLQGVRLGRVSPAEAESRYYAKHVTDQPIGSQNPKGA
jgi:hypothetical protein